MSFKKKSRETKLNSVVKLVVKIPVPTLEKRGGGKEGISVKSKRKYGAFIP